MLLATLKVLSRFPCPRCLVEKSDIDKLGMVSDFRRRSKRRVDNQNRQRKIDMVRECIFERGYKVGCKAIERVLENGSLVPVRVCLTLLALRGADLLIPTL